MNRKIVQRCLICIPVLWAFSTVIFFQYAAQIRQVSDETKMSTSIKTTFVIPTGEKWTKKLLENQPVNIEEQQQHVIRDGPQQVIPPDINETKFDPDAPGEMGKGIELKRTNLLPNELRKYESQFQKHAFNVYASDLISVHRRLPDVRDSACRTIEYKAPIVTASIVMCFHNEAWSVLLRSIHSVIDRSPSNMLKEIILVDDFSDMEHLKQRLDDYIKNLKIVSIIRQTKREGLIRSRLAGAAAVQGDIIVFLDSHIEVTEGWLQPLLDPISLNWTTVMTPIIDIIDDNTMKYNAGTSNALSVGGFDWSLLFTWHALPERIKKKRKHHLEPVETPTMAGGLFAISKKYFDYLGTYDAGMDIWGGENLEISFRIWMCGGRLLTTPCSHVGHIFRKRSPYSWGSGGNVLKKNTVRLAEVWLDDYKGNFGDVSSRKLLRKRLQCKSFEWYLTEIYPELFIPERSLAFGEIRSLAAGFCVDGSTNRNSLNKPVVAFRCHHQGGDQYFMLSVIGEIRRDDGCLDYAGGMQDMNKNNKVIIYQCHGQEGNQRWIYTENNQLYHSVSNLCLALSDDNNHIQMQRCDPKKLRHQWSWKRKTLNETNKA